MAKTELETALANVSALLDLAQWHALENLQRASSDLNSPYKITRQQGDQLMALLIVTDDYAKRVLAEHDEAGRRIEGEAA